MNKQLYFFACLFFVALVVVFLILLLLPPLNHTNTPNVHNGNAELNSNDNAVVFKNSFKHSNGNIQILSPDKPLYFTVTKDGPIKNAFVFASLFDSQSGFAIETQTEAHCFTFSVTKPVFVVALQVMDTLFTSEVRQVGIFNVETNTLLCSGNVSKTLDNVYSGFRTHTLESSLQTLLVPHTLYACVALVLPGDYFTTSVAFARNINILNMDAFATTETSSTTVTGQGYVGRQVSNQLVVPTTTSQRSFSSPFASFQLQEKQVPNTKVFEVDTQYARFPPHYIQGFKVDILANNMIQVTAGYCAAQYANANIVSQRKLTLQPFTGNAATWYAVYIVDSNVDGVYDPHLQISSNFTELIDVPTHRMRRIGWARSKPKSPSFFQSEQEGTEVRRDTVFMEPVFQWENLLTDGAIGTLILDNVPPGASECRLQLTSNFFAGSNSPQMPQSIFEITIGNIVLPLFKNQEYQVSDITVPLDQSESPQFLQIAPVFDSPDPCMFTFRITSYTEDL